ncbi:MAG TPA: hypothetical protein VLA62_08795, partial [Solirubrobacterales bacterium]|nr:hypothetical protein [Solirubrobacterales bacterium]
FTTYEPDPNRLALEPRADQLWEQLREDQPLGKQFTSKATKASEAKPGDPKGEPKTEEEREEAERVGLCT